MFKEAWGLFCELVSTVINWFFEGFDELRYEPYKSKTLGGNNRGNYNNE